MFRIGEFSQIAKVTIETLRHYDSLGLLEPVEVDPVTGYRYYSARQLRSLNHILALKEVGFSLEEIARILQDQPTGERLQDMFKAQLLRAERDVEAAQLRRERILARLHQLELEDHMPDYEVILKPVEPSTVVAIREVVPSIEQMPQRCGQMFATLAQWMQAHRLPFGPAMTVYYNEGFVRENIDTECAFVIPGADPAKLPATDPSLQVIQKEAIPLAACTVATGDFYQKVAGLTPAYQALARWVETNGYQFAGPPRELFHGSPETGDFTAEIQFPVTKA